MERYRSRWRWALAQVQRRSEMEQKNTVQIEVLNGGEPVARVRTHLDHLPQILAMLTEHEPRAGMPRPKRSTATAERNAQIVQAAAEGATAEELAETHGLALVTIKGIIRSAKAKTNRLDA